MVCHLKNTMSFLDLIQDSQIKSTIVYNKFIERNIYIFIAIFHADEKDHHLITMTITVLI